MSYTLRQSNIDVARLQKEINRFLRIVKAFPNLLDIKGNLKISGTLSGDGLDWNNYTPLITYGAGGTTNPDSETIDTARYCRISDLVFVRLKISIDRGSGDRTATLLTLPITAKDESFGCGVYHNLNGSTPQIAPGYFSTVSIFTVFHGAMTKDGSIRVSFTYEAA